MGMVCKKGVGSIIDDNTNGIIKVAKYGKINNSLQYRVNNSLTNIELVKNNEYFN